jgi:hypothetical protein
MRTLTAKLALLAIMVSGFTFTGDLPRLVEQATGAASSAARGLAGRTSAPPERHAPLSPADSPRAPEETAQEAPRAPEETVAGATPPQGRPVVECVPLPPLRRGPVLLAGLEPGDRVLVRVSGELLAFDLIDAASGEAIEHRHVVREDGTVHVSAREAPRRVRIHPVHAPLAAGGGILVESSAGGPAGSPVSRMIGPIIALGVDHQ